MRKPLLVAIISGALLIGVVFGVAAQSELTGYFAPFVVDIEQQVPVEVSVAVPVEGGDSFTATVPMTVNVALRVSVEGPNVVSVEPLEETEPEVAIATATPQPASSASQATLPGTYGIGDAFSLGDVTVTVNSAEMVEGGSFNTPDPGMKFLAVDISMENKGNEAIGVGRFMPKLKDSTGQLYSIDLMATTAAGTIPSGDIVPGEVMRGQYGFEVPEEATGLVLTFDLGMYNLGKAFIELE